MTEVAEGVDTSIALVKMIKHRCKGYRLDLKVRYAALFGSFFLFIALDVRVQLLILLIAR